MAIFPDIKIENIVQVNDKTRIDCRDSFISKDEGDVTKVEIKPSTSGDYIEVTGSSSSDWYLDWAYTGAAVETVTCRITTDSTPVTLSDTIIVLSETDDRLLSNDSDLTRHEPDILNCIQDGRNSFKNIHRLAQDLILQYLDKNGYVNDYGYKFRKEDLLPEVDVSNQLEKFYNFIDELNYTFDATKLIFSSGSVILRASGGVYPTDNPTLLTNFSLNASNITSITESVSKSGSDNIKYVLNINNQDKWVNSGTVEDSAGTYAESNTLAEITAALPDFNALLPGILKIKAFFHSDDGTTTPTLSKISVNYDVTKNIQTSDFCVWAKYIVLRLIFEGLSNATDDIYHEKAVRYKGMEMDARQRVILRLDTNSDGKLDDYEDLSVMGRIYRR